MAAITKPTPHTLSPDKLRNFMLGGKAIFTVQSPESGKHITYLIEQLEDKKEGLKQLWFLKVLTSPDNTSDYSFAGSLFEREGKLIYKHSEKSSIGSCSPSVKGFEWILYRLNVLALGDADNQASALNSLSRMNISHAGYCAKCGLMLTHPKSVERGFGPTCYSKA